MLQLCVLVFAQLFAFGAGFQLPIYADVAKVNPLIQNDAFAQPLLNQQNTRYFVTIGLGTPPQYFDVLLDTGSSLLWVPAIGCRGEGPNIQYCRPGATTHLYNPRRSTTAKKSYTPFERDYLLGRVTGKLYEDVFVFGDASGKQIAMKKPVVFGVGEELFYDDIGVLGLGFDDGRPGSRIFQEAVAEKLMDKALFTIFMHKCPKNGEKCKGGVVTFGKIDEENCGPVLAWTPVHANEQHWQFTIEKITLDEKTVVGRTKAVTDSGGSSIHVPRALFTRIITELGAQHRFDHYFLPCDSVFELSLQISGRTFTLVEDQLLLPNTDGYCILMMEPLDLEDEDLWILGQPFIRSFCQVHDLGARRLGLAKARQVRKGKV